MSSVSVEAVVREYWRLMGTNDFGSLASVLAADFVLEWPQSRERVRGAERYAQLNTDYPSHGPWRFSVRQLVSAGSEAVSDVEVTDGVVLARAISFFTIEAGRISRIVEFWPEPYEAPGWRAHLVESME